MENNGHQALGKQHFVGQRIDVEPAWQSGHGYKLRELKTTLELATNTGTKTTKQVADVPGFGTVWYDETAIANTFGLSDLKKKHRITFDSEKKDAFIVHTDNGKMKF
jgi:hypothetical protein